MPQHSGLDSDDLPRAMTGNESISRGHAIIDEVAKWAGAFKDVEKKE